MQSVFEKIKERLEETEKRLLEHSMDISCTIGIANAMTRAIEIVIQVAEEYSNSEIPNYSDRWIPCNERMPEEHMDKELHMSSDLVQVTMIDEDGNSYVLDDCTLDGEWCNAGDLFEVIAWQPLPAPYPPKGE